MDPTFKPGMLVAYGEFHRGRMTKVITISTVKTVGKRFIRTNGGAGQHRLSGQSTDEVYQDRWILPLTKALYAQAQWDEAFDLGLALGHVLPD